MTINQHIARQTRWVAGNFAFNLDYIPSDKWNWKPAASASSAAEITVHITETLHRAALMIGGATWDEAESQLAHSPATSVETAKAGLIKAADAFATQVEKLTPKEGERILALPFGEFPVAQFVSMDLLDLIHHHGQIAYIQTLLGDIESHFMEGDF